MTAVAKIQGLSHLGYWGKERKITDTYGLAALQTSDIYQVASHVGISVSRLILSFEYFINMRNRKKTLIDVSQLIRG